MSKVQINNFNNDYGFYKNDSSKAQPKKEVQEEQQPSITPELKNVEAKEILSAMNILGAQRFAQVSGKAQINPKDYLSDERIADIENSMKLFEQGVEKYKDAIKEEFSNIFSEATVNALAAEAFSRE